MRAPPSGMVSVLGAGSTKGVIHAVEGSPSVAGQPVATGRPLTRRSAVGAGGARQLGEDLVARPR